MQTENLRTVRTIRLSDVELAAIREASATAGLPWTVFVRGAALAAARRQIIPATPATVDVRGEAVALSETPEA